MKGSGAINNVKISKPITETIMVNTIHMELTINLEDNICLEVTGRVKVKYPCFEYRFVLNILNKLIMVTTITAIMMPKAMKPPVITIKSLFTLLKINGRIITPSRIDRYIPVKSLQVDLMSYLINFFNI